MKSGLPPILTGRAFAILLTASLFVSLNALNAQIRSGPGIVPRSSIEMPSDVGVNMHTNYAFYAPNGIIEPAANPGGETPGSLACVYGLVSQTPGCVIAN